MSVNLSEFLKFHCLLTKNRPDYKPHYIKLKHEGKDPVDGRAWKNNPAGVSEACNWMQNGYNVGIVAHEKDVLVIVDVDDITQIVDIKPTLCIRSRKRNGMHHFYFTKGKDRSAKINVPVEKKGEVRGSNQYVVCAGSFVKSDGIKVDDPKQKIFVGRYTVEKDLPVLEITFDDLPQNFRDQYTINKKTFDAEYKKKDKEQDKLEKEFLKNEKDKKKSALYSLRIEQIVSGHSDGLRFSSPFHGSDTGQNTGISGELLHCFRCNVSHSPLTALAVLSGIDNCANAGYPHKNGGAGKSTINLHDGNTLFRIWSYAKKQNIIPIDDLPPTQALVWLAIEKKFCDKKDLQHGWKLPKHVYTKTINHLVEIKLLPPEAEIKSDNIKDLLMKYVTCDSVELFHTDKKQAYARIPIDEEHFKILPVDDNDGKEFREWLSYQYFKDVGSAPSGTTIYDVVNTICGKAKFEGKEYKLWNRVCSYDGGFWYDLGNHEAVKIKEGKCEIVKNVPILFRSYTHQKPHTNVKLTGNAKKILDFTNIIKDDKMKLLYLITMITDFIPDISHAVQTISGTSGFGKSTLMMMQAGVIDPSVEEGIISFPKDDKELVQILDHHYFCGFDNVSGINQYESDVLCKAVTGGAVSKRALYSNEDDVIFQYKRCISMNGLNSPIVNEDLESRNVNYTVKMTDTIRISEKELKKQYTDSIPEILGGVFETVAKAQLIYPTIKIDDIPRMGDYVMWGCAISEALGYGKEAFLDAYRENRQNANIELINSSVIGSAIMEFMSDKPEWQGEPTELYSLIDGLVKIKSPEAVKEKYYPKAPNSFMRYISKIVNSLNKVGVTIEYPPKKDNKKQIILRNESIEIKDWKETVKETTDKNQPYRPLITDKIELTNYIKSVLKLEWRFNENSKDKTELIYRNDIYHNLYSTILQRMKVEPVEILDECVSTAIQELFVKRVG